MPDQISRPGTPPEEKTEVTVADTPVMVSEKEEISSQEVPDSVKSDNGEVTLSRRDEIYANHDAKNRVVTEKEEPTEPEESPSEEELDALAEELTTGENVEGSEKPKEKKKPGPKPQVDVTVNGIHRKVDKDKVDAHGGVEAYQSMVAAQEKLRLAADERKQLEARKAELDQREKELEKRTLAQREESQRSTPDLAPVEDRSSGGVEVEDALETLLDGDATKMAEVLKGNLRPAETIDVDRVKAELKEELKAEQEAVNIQHMEQQFADEVATARAEFAIDFPEIMADQNLYSLADQYTDRIARGNPELSPSQVCRQAGEEVANWANQRNMSVVENSMQVKAEEKRSMRSPTPGSARSERPPEPKVETKSDYVAKLKAQRGQM